jgi:hypothetical protein
MITIKSIIENQDISFNKYPKNQKTLINQLKARAIIVFE